MRKNILFIIFINLLFILIAKEKIIFPKVETPPRIDGRITFNEWENAIVRDEFYQTSPGDNTEPSEKTEFFMCYDDENLYFLAKCYMKDLSLIRDFHCSRDRIYTTDRVLIFLDTFGTNDRAYYVVANANGEQADGIVLDDIDPTIDFYFESMGNRTDYGWMVEIAIPFKSLKYKSGKNITWGGFLKRNIPERNEEITSFPIKRGGGNFYDNYGLFQFENITKNQNLKVIPSVIGSYDIEKTIIADSLGNYQETKNSDSDADSELNVFYEPNSNMTFTTTINPDFNIIEADGLNVDVNLRYLRYFSEKRPFFIEETNPFRTDIIIFHTRQIESPKWGAKFSGSFGNTSSYALAAVDEDANGERFGYDEEYLDTPFGFVSICQKFRNGNSFFRAAGTFRKYDDYENYVASFDMNNRFLELFDSDVQIAVSSNEILKDEVEVEVKRGFAYDFDIDFYNSTWFISFETKALTKDFTADLGHISETDINLFKNRTEFQIHSKTDNDFIRYMEFASTQNVQFDYDLKDIKSFYWEVMNGGMFKNTFEYWTGVEYMMENYLNQDFYMHYPWLVVKYEPIKSIRGEILLVDGRGLYYGDEEGENANYYKYETTLFYRPTNNIDIEFKQRYHELEEKYIARTYETKVKFQFHKNFWIRAIIQVTNNNLIKEDYDAKSINLYPLFTYKPSSNTAVYLGASNGWYDEDYTGDIWDEENQLYFQKQLRYQQDNMTYFIKISYTFDIL
ncbi:MAG: carbohydrate binding family 9 domain-containing protein [Candidatus Cloacimonetes bacterium]|nr:carbohydrate binding family 9 domain-containing protein [Candidatus Cloacimonadota bacterium]